MVVVNLNSLDQPIPHSHCPFKIHFESEREAIDQTVPLTWSSLDSREPPHELFDAKGSMALNLKGDGEYLPCHDVLKRGKTVSQYECLGQRCSKLIREVDHVGCCGNMFQRVDFNPHEGFSRTHQLMEARIPLVVAQRPDWQQDKSHEASKGVCSDTAEDVGKWPPMRQ